VVILKASIRLPTSQKHLHTGIQVGSVVVDFIWSQQKKHSQCSIGFSGQKESTIQCFYLAVLFLFFFCIDLRTSATALDIISFLIDRAGSFG